MGTLPSPIPFSIMYFPPPERAIPAQFSQCLLQKTWHRKGWELPRAPVPVLLPKALASQQDRDWKVALKSSTYNPPLLFLTVSPAGTEVSIRFLIDSTPGSFFLAVPAGRMWCIKESQRLKLERPMVFNHFLHPPTWAGVFLTIFFFWCSI